MKTSQKDGEMIMNSCIHTPCHANNCGYIPHPEKRNEASTAQMRKSTIGSCVCECASFSRNISLPGNRLWRRFLNSIQYYTIPERDRSKKLWACIEAQAPGGRNGGVPYALVVDTDKHFWRYRAERPGAIGCEPATERYLPERVRLRWRNGFPVLLSLVCGIAVRWCWRG